MKQLPAALHAWRPWLSLFPPELAEPLGQLMLRLHPQVGPLRSAPARADSMPEGVGSITARGQYERLLMTEWAYADAEPDEFIRRASSGELMFTGPEPAARQRSRRCVALFDAGPLQLGEPRLLHLALFILLARRAEEAGAAFEWGVLQTPGVLRGGSGADAMGKLLKSRTLEAASAATLDGWREQIDEQVDDVWIISHPRLAACLPARALVGVRRHLLQEALDVTITLARTSRSFSLPLPPADIGTRLLREPFRPIASRARAAQLAARPPLHEAPRFSVHGRNLAIVQPDGGVVLYAIPNSTKAAPGKARHQAPLREGVILAAGLFGKHFGTMLIKGKHVAFKGFNSRSFGSHATCALPAPDQFDATSPAGRWRDCFFVRDVKEAPDAWSEQAAVLVLDDAGNLGVWTATTTIANGTSETSPVSFQLLARNVIGVVQMGERLIYAKTRDNHTVLHEWRAGASSSTEITAVAGSGTRMLFGSRVSWVNPRVAGVAAMQMDATRWMVHENQTWSTITLSDDMDVIGVASSAQSTEIGLVAVCQASNTIELHGTKDVTFLVHSVEPIARASVCPQTGDLAWIGATSGTVTVTGINQGDTFLVVKAKDGQHAA